MTATLLISSQRSLFFVCAWLFYPVLPPGGRCEPRRLISKLNRSAVLNLDIMMHKLFNALHSISLCYCGVPQGKDILHGPVP